jgi:hypothetical protein
MTLIETVIVIGSVIGRLITTSCWSVRRSPCETIGSPCVTCRRKPMTDLEMRHDAMNNDLTNRTDSEPCYTRSVPPTPIKRSRLSFDLKTAI